MEKDVRLRRNAFGIRPVALAVALIVLTVSVILLALGHGTTSSRFSRWGVSTAVSIAAVLYWSLVVKESWVRRAAELYIRRNPALAERALRFDVMVITPWAWPRHIVDAWRDN